MSALLHCRDCLNLPRRVVLRLKNSGWTPRSAPDVSVGASSESAPGVSVGASSESKVADARRNELLAMQVRLSEALACAHDGQPDTAYERAMARLGRVTGLSLGTKHTSRKFVVLAEELGQSVVRAMQSAEMECLLPSLGVPSDICWSWDGVSLGASNFSRHETLLLLTATYSRVTKLTSTRHGQAARLTSRLVAAPSFGQNHGGQDQVALIREALLKLPKPMDRRALVARFALGGGDGAVSIGGEDHRHSCSQAAKLFAKSLFRIGAPGVPAGAQVLIPTDWGLFHRIDIAVKHAMGKHPAVKEVLDVARAMGGLFGVGDGRVVLRSAAQLLGDVAKVTPDQSGTRKIVALVRTVTYLIDNFCHLHAGMHARILQKQGQDSHGSHTIQELVSVARRLSNMDFAVFLLALDDFLTPTIVAVALKCQDEGTGAVELHAYVEGMKRNISDRLTNMECIRRWCTVTALVSTELSKEDIIRLWSVLRRSPLGRAFPRVVGGMAGLLLGGSCCGVPVKATPASEYPETDLVGLQSICLSPRCQCWGMRSRPKPDPRPENKHCLVGSPVEVATGRSQTLMVRVPEWVAPSPYPPASWRAFASNLDCRPRFHCVPKDVMSRHPDCATPSWAVPCQACTVQVQGAVAAPCKACCHRLGLADCEPIIFFDSG